jgi:hypothetical protein
MALYRGNRTGNEYLSERRPNKWSKNSNSCPGKLFIKSSTKRDVSRDHLVLADHTRKHHHYRRRAGKELNSTLPLSLNFISLDDVLRNVYARYFFERRSIKYVMVLD